MSKYVYDHGLTQQKTFTVETLGGIMKPVVSLGEDGKVEQVTIDMGEPRFERAAIPMTGIPEEQAREEVLEVDGTVFTMTAVSMGNPHAIIFVDEVGTRTCANTGRRSSFTNGSRSALTSNLSKY